MVNLEDLLDQLKAPPAPAPAPEEPPMQSRQRQESKSEPRQAPQKQEAPQGQPQAGGAQQARRPREVAKRVFAIEFNTSALAFKDEPDEQLAPTYLLTPTGARCNRVLVVGVLTDKEEPDDNYWRATLDDPTGSFTLYAGQYNPEAANFLAEVDLSTPKYVMVVGRASLYQTDSTVYTSIRPEHIVLATEADRDRWNIETAEHYVERLLALKDGSNADAIKALDYYKPPEKTKDEWLKMLALPPVVIVKAAQEKTTARAAPKPAGEAKPPSQAQAAAIRKRGK